MMSQRSLRRKAQTEVSQLLEDMGDSLMEENVVGNWCNILTI